MKQAYVLINCNAPKNTLIEQIKNIKGVKEVQGTYGAYSIIVKVEEQKGNTPINTIIRKI